MRRYIGILSVLLLALAAPAWAVTSVQVNTTEPQTVDSKTMTNMTASSPTITGTVAGGATFSAITLTSPTLSGSITGSPTWPSPGVIGGGTPSAGTFTTVTATGCVFVGGTSIKVCSGAGTPEAAVTAPVASLFLRSNGGTGTTFYIKETGSGNTGWVPFSTSAVNWTTPGTIGSTTPNTGAFTTLSVTGQFSSTLATGTAPMVIASTTKVTNLNSDLLDNADWAAPPAIGSTTPAAITGTTITATSCFVVITTKVCAGSGSPEGVVTAPVSSQYYRTDGGSGSTLYQKVSGTGNAGWEVMAPGVATWDSPGSIGGVSPNAGAFTNLTAYRFYSRIQNPVYGATVTPLAGDGNVALITVTNGTPFLIANPSGVPFNGQWLIVQVKNQSGGVITAQWDSLYAAETFTAPAAGKHRSAYFLYHDGFWDLMFCGPEVTNR